MQRLAFFTRTSDVDSIFKSLNDSCEENKISWCNSVISKSEEIIKSERSNDILFNHDGRGNISIVCFYENRLRIHNCSQGTQNFGTQYFSQFHVFDFSIPDSIDYLDSVEVNNELIINIKIRGRENEFKIFINNPEEYLNSIIRMIYKD